MKGFVPTCHALLCERPAKVRLRGTDWCTAHAYKRFDFVTSRPVTGAAPLDAGEPGTSRPPAAAGVQPQPLYDDPLVALLEENGWDLLDIELELISHLEGQLGW